MPWLLAFQAGLVSTPLFHRGLFELRHPAAAVPQAAWNMTAALSPGMPMGGGYDPRPMFGALLLAGGRGPGAVGPMKLDRQG